MPIFEFPQEDGSKIQIEGDTPEDAESHIPEIQQYLASQKNSTTVEKTTPGTESQPEAPKSALGQIKEAITSQLPDAGTAARITWQGVPLVGNLVPDSDTSKQYSEQHPYISGGLSALGTVGGTLAAGAVAPEALGALGLSKLAQGAGAVRSAIGTGTGKLITGLGIGSGAVGLEEILGYLKSIHSHHSE